MPFLLYSCKHDDKGNVTFSYVRKVQEIPRIIGSYVRERSTKGCITPLPWHMPEPEILHRFTELADEHALVIDLKPKERGNVSLYQVKDIWGFSYEGWTPVALRLETLFTDEYIENSEEFKRQFNDRSCERERVHEFLYLRAGTKEGTWNWGMIGFVNGALLWPDALDYFISEIRKNVP